MSPAQLTLDAAIAAQEKELHLDLVELHNLSVVQAIRKLAVQMAQRDGSVTMDRLRVAATGLGLIPDHPNAYGAVFRGKGWQCIGMQPSALVSSHGRFIRQWTYRPQPEPQP